MIVAVAMGGLYFFNYYFSPEQKALREFEELEKLYAEDTYGGETPEETLQLFIDALKAGDIELASKYFVIEKQEEWESNLHKINDNGFLQEMVSDLNRSKDRYKISDGQTGFDIANDQNEVALTILVGRNSNGLWKIIDM